MRILRQKTTGLMRILRQKTTGLMRSKSTELLLHFGGLPHLWGRFFPILFVRVLHAQFWGYSTAFSLSDFTSPGNR